MRKSHILTSGLAMAIRPQRSETWIMLAASIDPPTVQVLGIICGRYTPVKKEAEKRAEGCKTLVLGTHQSTETMGKLVAKWMIDIGVPEQYHESFVQALGRALSKALGYIGDDDVSYTLPSVAPGEQGSQADGDEG